MSPQLATAAACPKLRHFRGTFAVEHASWDDHQLRLTQNARLLFASPETVFAELKAWSEETRANPFRSNSEIAEPLLIERGHPLINIGLACYGTDRSVFKALYNHGLGTPTDTTDAQYRRGLLLGCLSNTTIQKTHFIFDFPRELIGSAEIERLLYEADYALAETLIRNPEVSDKLLEQLYKFEGPFEALPEDRLSALISGSRHNERLNTNNDDDHSPDLGHYRIHNAILQLLETAPVTLRWMWTLYDLLNSLSPTCVARSERLPALLQRWKPLEAANNDDAGSKGLFAEHISPVDEFRCLIAALYGGGLDDPGLHGALKSSDVAMRSAHYGNAAQSIKEMRASYTKDGDAYVFAALRNTNVILRHEQRQLVEGEMLPHDFRSLYSRLISQFRLRYPSVPPYSEQLG